MIRGWNKGLAILIGVVLVALPLLLSFALPASAGSVVSPDGWEWQNPLPQGNTLWGIWGSSPSDIFAVGNAGTILHYNGNAWTHMNSGTTANLHNVWGTSASNVYVVGDAGTILHYNGSSWASMTSGTSQTLHGIWGSSATDIFAVGTAGGIIHYDGSAWSPMVNTTAVRPCSIWGMSSTDVFAAGTGVEEYYGTTISCGAIIHYDGSSWTDMPPIDGLERADLWAVWGMSSSDAFVVGDDGHNTPRLSGVVLHYNGSAWSKVYSPFDQFGQRALRGVWGSSSTDVFAVGARGTIGHYDGSAWSLINSGTLFDLNAVWGTSSSEVWAVGQDGIILHYQDQAGPANLWTRMSSGTTVSLSDAWGSSSSDVFVVGQEGTILHYNGSQWQPMPSGTSNTLNGVWGASPADVFAVGDGGTILHYDGNTTGTWATMASGTSSDIHGVWGSASNDVFAVSYAYQGDIISGTTLHYDGSAWGVMPGGPPLPHGILYGLCGDAGGNVFAVGSGAGEMGIVLHYDGTQWTEMKPTALRGWNSSLNAVWGSSPTDVFAVGYEATFGNISGWGWGAIIHYDGQKWSLVLSGLPYDLPDVWGSSPTNAFAVGKSWVNEHYRGTILSYDGLGWSQQIIMEADGLNSVWGTSSSDVFAVGDNGTILHYFKQPSPTLTAVSPNQGYQGQTLNVTITGTNLAGAAGLGFGGGIKVNSFTVDSSTQITANITIAVEAAHCSRDISVTTPGGTATLAGRFIVTAPPSPQPPPPTLTCVSLNQGYQGQTLDVIITGTNLSDATSLRFGEGIHVNGCEVLSPTRKTAGITIACDAAPGPREISVTTPGGSATLPDGFTVKKAPSEDCGDREHGHYGQPQNTGTDNTTANSEVGSAAAQQSTTPGPSDTSGQGQTPTNDAPGTESGSISRDFQETTWYYSMPSWVWAISAAGAAFVVATAIAFTLRRATR